MKLLFICTGNICRSAMAEMLAHKIALERHVTLEARSCGIAAESYFEVPAGVWNALAPLGMSRREHKPQLVARELLKWCDLALTMTFQHREFVIDKYPEFTRKVHVLRAYAGLKGDDIADPYGRPDPFYVSCRDKIYEALEALIEHEHAKNPGS